MLAIMKAEILDLIEPAQMNLKIQKPAGMRFSEDTRYSRHMRDSWQWVRY